MNQRGVLWQGAIHHQFDWKEVLFHPAFTRGVRDPPVIVGDYSLSPNELGVCLHNNAICRNCCISLDMDRCSLIGAISLQKWQRFLSREGPSSIAFHCLVGQARLEHAVRFVEMQYKYVYNTYLYNTRLTIMFRRLHTSWAETVLVSFFENCWTVL